MNGLVAAEENMDSGLTVFFKCGRKLPMKGAKTETGDNPYAIGIRWTLSQTIFVHDIPTSDSTEKKNMPPRDM